MRAYKNCLFFIAGAAIPVALIGVLIFAWWLRDVGDDRKHTVIANATTPIFAGSGVDGGCHGTRLTTVERGVRFRVQRIRYLKDCATIDVVLSDGREGYFVLGVGDVSVNPPLPTI